MKFVRVFRLILMPTGLKFIKRENHACKTFIVKFSLNFSSPEIHVNPCMLRVSKITRKIKKTGLAANPV